MPSREVGQPPTRVGGALACYMQYMYYTLDTPRCPSRKTPRRGTARRNAYDEAPYGIGSDHHILGNTIVSRCPCADLHGARAQCSAPGGSVCTLHGPQGRM